MDSIGEILIYQTEDGLTKLDIRSSKKVLYRQVLDLYATSVDYNPQSEESIEQQKRAKDFIEIGIDAEEYYRIKDSEKNADE